jgi:protein-S-isoprenylcysteine O-methyltransferase Ste14
VAIGGGFWLIAVGWRHLHEAAQADRLATSGPYAWVRHPQYDGFLLVMIGFLLQWPTIPTLIMFPVLVCVYARLARTEEHAVANYFGREWDEYAAHTPAFVPKLGRFARNRSNGTDRQPNITSRSPGGRS